MARNSEGEFEMVLGNKQLLSLLFLVVVLFAVFFSLGYMVGKSVSPAQTLAAQPPAAETPASRTPLPEPVKEPPMRRQAEPPALTEPAPAPSEPVAVRTPVPETNEPAKPAAAPAPPLREMHLQIAAVRVRADAEALAASLRQKGYTVTLNSDGGDAWHRVLVGPFFSEKSAQETKLLLERDGYKSILKKP
ncbi:MAG: SPOR domain-containing protein [Acidobacteria bacterium]|nr:SPOR domain-containing protein [Acidobacteriota bacterium]